MPRHYHAALLGHACPYCGLPVPKALCEADQYAHPTCGPSELDLIIEGRGRRFRSVNGGA